MARLLRVSTEITVQIGPFLDKTDGVAEETGLAGNATEISKDGAAFGAGPTLGTHVADGWYPITLTTTHTNTLGPFTVKSQDSATHLPVWEHFMVVPANVYDSLVDGVEWLTVDSMKPDWSIAGGTLTVKKPNDSDTAYTKTLTTTAGANPITAAT
jgi:hypothetical protein